MASAEEAPALPPGFMPCPWCGRVWAKNEACNWVCCGLTTTKEGFRKGEGCGQQWCFSCGKKLCGLLYEPASGLKVPGVAESHSASCACLNDGTYCPGGHNSHCPKRW